MAAEVGGETLFQSARPLGERRHGHRVLDEVAGFNSRAHGGRDSAGVMTSAA